MSKRCPEEWEDREFVERFQSGTDQFFDCLVLRYQNSIYSLCVRMLGNSEDAEECAQEAFVKAYRSIKSFRFDASFSSWMYRIAMNTCRDRRRSSQFTSSRKMVSLDMDNPDSENTKRWDVADKGADPVRQYEKKELKEILVKAIMSLPDPQDTLVYLRDIEGLSYEEIADVTGIKKGTIKSKLSRARELLQRKLQGVINYEM